jgi:ABC-2 type transport system permease protein
MTGFQSAFWAELLKARRSKVSLLSVIAFLIFPIVDGLFMFILKDPQRAQSMGLISAKAQLTAGAADWPTFFQVLLLGTAVGGAVLFAFITAWIFGREFSDHTAKELLALPTRRETIVSAKFLLIALWTLILALMIFMVGIGIGAIASIPGWSPELAWLSFGSLMLIALLTFLLMPFVALLASVGHGYLPPLAWAFLTLALAQIAGVMGWGEWFPWSVPGILVNLNEARIEPLQMHSLAVVLLASFVGAAVTFIWWRSADQTR